jgi:hypothetical protein
VQAAVLEFAGAAAATKGWVAFDAWAAGADAAIGSSASLASSGGAARLRVDAYSIAKGVSLRTALPASLVLRATAARFSALDWRGALADEAQSGFNVTGTFTQAQRVRRHEKSYVLDKPLRCVRARGRRGRTHHSHACALTLTASRSDPPRHARSHAAARALVALVAANPLARIKVHAYGGAVAARAAAASAFPHRGAHSLVQVAARWAGNASAAAAAERWLARVDALLRPLAAGSYVNYLDDGLGAGWERAYYGANYARLQRVKAAYDAQHFFAFPGQAVVPANGTSPCVYEPCL